MFSVLSAMTAPLRSVFSTGTAGPSSIVIVVGASSGIGRACSHQFAQRGSHLVLAARSERALEDVAAECRQRGAASVLVAPTDVLDASDVRQLMDATLAAHGGVDVLVFAAGVMAYGTVEDVPGAVFARVVDTALHGTASVARTVLPVFRRQDAGTMVVVTSLVASVPVPQMGAYIAGKWGQLAVARILQLETRDRPRINVCTVAPGAVDTPIYELAANFSGRVGQPPPPVARPDRIAAAVIGCVDHPRRNVSVGYANPIVILGFRLLPKVYDAFVTPLFKRFALSSQSVEPSSGNVFEPDHDHPHRPNPAMTA